MSLSQSKTYVEKKAIEDAAELREQMIYLDDIQKFEFSMMKDVNF